MAYSPTEDAMAHHAANTAAVVVPLTSALLHLPEILTCLVSFMGILWYGILMYDWIVKKIQIAKQVKQSSVRVAAPILEEKHPDAHTPDCPAPPTN